MLPTPKKTTWAPGVTPFATTPVAVKVTTGGERVSACIAAANSDAARRTIAVRALIDTRQLRRAVFIDASDTFLPMSQWVGPALLWTERPSWTRELADIGVTREEIPLPLIDLLLLPSDFCLPVIGLTPISPPFWHPRSAEDRTMEPYNSTPMAPGAQPSTATAVPMNQKARDRSTAPLTEEDLANYRGRGR